MAVKLFSLTHWFQVHRVYAGPETNPDPDSDGFFNKKVSTGTGTGTGIENKTVSLNYIAVIFKLLKGSFTAFLPQNFVVFYVTKS